MHTNHLKGFQVKVFIARFVAFLLFIFILISAFRLIEEALQERDLNANDAEEIGEIFPYFKQEPRLIEYNQFRLYAVDVESPGLYNPIHHHRGLFIPRLLSILPGYIFRPVKPP